jgi:hypothetical protein
MDHEILEGIGSRVSMYSQCITNFFSARVIAHFDKNDETYNSNKFPGLALTTLPPSDPLKPPIKAGKISAVLYHRSLYI